jgi:hypothetical protein
MKLSTGKQRNILLNHKEINKNKKNNNVMKE